MKDIGQARGAEEAANMIEHCCSFTVRDWVQAVMAMCVWGRESTGPWLGSLEALGGGLHQHLGNAHVLNRERGVADKTHRSEVCNLWESCQSLCKFLTIDCEQGTQQSR